MADLSKHIASSALFHQLIDQSFDNDFIQILNKIFNDGLRYEYISRFTPLVGKTICAFLNTVGGRIRVKYDGKDYDKKKAELEENLKKIYKHFNRSPSKWIKIYASKKEEEKVLIIEILFPNDYRFFTYEKRYYYRVGSKNEILLSGDINEIIRNRRKALKLPVLSDYLPSDEKKEFSFNEAKEKNRVSYLLFGEQSEKGEPYYKYLSLDVVLSIFRKVDKDKLEEGQRNPPQTLQFVEPLLWPDQYERRFYTADYKKVKRYPNAAPKLYATCFTTRNESEPAWQIYNREKKGLGMRCVQFRFNQVALREELVNNLEDCTIVEGVVDYKSKTFIDELHLSTTKDGKPSEVYERYFSDFTLDNFISLLLLKRTAFEHEKEVRIFLVFDEDNDESKSMKKEDVTPKYISLDWLSILEEIKVDSDCSKIEIALLQDEIDKLIDDSSRTEREKKILRSKLKVQTYDVNKDEHQEPHLKIGETYADYEKRL